jgi:hypothetical protein
VDERVLDVLAPKNFFGIEIEDGKRRKKFRGQEEEPAGQVGSERARTLLDMRVLDLAAVTCTYWVLEVGRPIIRAYSFPFAAPNSALAVNAYNAVHVRYSIQILPMLLYV